MEAEVSLEELIATSQLTFFSIETVDLWCVKTKNNHWGDSLLYQYVCDLFKLENRQTHGYGTEPVAL